MIDAAAPRPEQEIAVVEEVLRELRCDDRPRWRILNKSDRVRDLGLVPLLRRDAGETLLLSGRTGEGIDLLRSRLAAWARAGGGGAGPPPADAPSSASDAQTAPP